MTPQQLIGVAVRLFAVWLALTSIPYWASIPAQLKATDLETGASVALSYGLAGAYLLAAIAMWVFPMSVAHTLLPRTQHDNRLELSGAPLARVGVALLGLWLLSKAVPSLVWFLLRSMIYVEGGSAFSMLPPDAKLDMAVAAAEIVLATLFFVKSRTIAAWMTSSNAEKTTSD